MTTATTSGKPVLAGAGAARRLAVVMTLGVGTAAFVLSFSALSDLATMAHVASGLAWLLPVVIDGTIVLATVGWLSVPPARRRFFRWLLAAGALVSITGNGLHAVAGADRWVLSWWVCALVATVPPISLLADTHGLAILTRPTTPEPASTVNTATTVDSVVDTTDSSASPVTTPSPVVPTSRPARVARTPAVGSIPAGSSGLVRSVATPVSPVSPRVIDRTPASVPLSVPAAVPATQEL